MKKEREENKKMSKWFSFTASSDWFFRHLFTLSGLRSITTDLKDGTTMHCWVPKSHHTSKPNLLLIHGFGANAMWQYGDLIRHFSPKFNIYVPDLLFFGGSYTLRLERTESFQARCLMRLMGVHGVRKMSVVGISYGGFVGYSLAVQYAEAVERLVVCSSGVCVEERDMEEGLFKVADVEEAADILLPQTPHKLRELMRFAFVNPVTALPSCFLSDFIHVMCTDHVKEKKELIHAILKDRQLSNLPKVTQRTLVIWGEQDQIFPLELGKRLQRHIGENARLVVIKKAGHAVNLEKPREFTKHLKEFLLDFKASPPHHKYHFLANRLTN